jgi:hypothetical protein
MHQADRSDENSGLVWIAQTLLAVIFPLVWSISSASFVNWLSSSVHKPLIAEAGNALALSQWVINLPLAVTVRSLFPRTRATGKLAWIVPVILFALLLAGSAISGIRHTLSAAFGDGSLFTEVAFSSLMYSLGMSLESRKTRTSHVRA